MPRVFRRLFLTVVVLGAVGCISAARQEKAAGRVGLGSAYLREGNIPGAVRTLEEAARLDRRNWAAFNKLGLAYMAAGSTEKAGHAFERAMKLNEDEAELLVNYGNLLVRTGRLEEAAATFEVAAQDLTYRKPSIALSNLGFVRLQQGQHAEALAVLDQAIRRAPNLCQAHFNRGLVHEAMGSHDFALEDFEAVIEMCGEDASGAYLQAGMLLIDQKDRNTGCTYILTAVQDAGDTPLGREARQVHRQECV